MNVRFCRIFAGFVLAFSILTTSQPVRAQYFYPGGYGRYGFLGFAQDPASGYMTGLGNFARSQGAYQVDAANAAKINTETMVRWNQILRAEQKRLDAERQQSDAQRAAQANLNATRASIEDGSLLNSLLFTLADYDPSAASSLARRGPTLSAAGVREIPFQWNTEAITLCIDQMLGKEVMPDNLEIEALAPEREALGKAVQKALAEDRKGDVSAATMKQVNDAVKALRAKFVATSGVTAPGYFEADRYVTTLGSLTRLLHDPSMARALAELENVKEIKVGTLIAFMQTYNLRFGPATTARQSQLYAQLVDILGGIQRELAQNPPPAAPAPGGKVPLIGAAKDAFQDMTWDHLEAHEKSR